MNSNGSYQKGVFKHWGKLSCNTLLHTAEGLKKNAFHNHATLGKMLLTPAANPRLNIRPTMCVCTHADGLRAYWYIYVYINIISLLTGMDENERYCNAENETR